MCYLGETKDKCAKEMKRPIKRYVITVFIWTIVATLAHMGMWFATYVDMSQGVAETILKATLITTSSQSASLIAWNLIGLVYWLHNHLEQCTTIHKVRCSQ